MSSTEQATGDQLGPALQSLGSGVLLGSAVIASTLWIVRTLQVGAPPTSVPDPSGREGNILLGGTMLGAVIAGGSTWVQLADIRSVFRRGGLSLRNPAAAG